MPEITVTRAIAATPEQVWEALADFGNIAAFNPNLAGSHILDGAKAAGQGAERRCDLRDGKNYLLERVVDWQPGRSYTVDIYESSMPLRTARATLGADAASGGTATARMTIAYTVKFGPLGAVMDALMLRRMMRGV